MKIIYTLCFLFSICSLLTSQGDPARQEMNLDVVYDQYDVSGEGVITAIIDRGIDYRRPDFLDENGNTRIAYIYDILDDSGEGDPDNPYGIGTIHSADEINAALSMGGNPITNDRHGHGTASTELVAGNGNAASDPQFHGVDW